MTYHARANAGGRIVIPALLRREIGIGDGDTLVVARMLAGPDPAPGLAIRPIR